MALVVGRLLDIAASATPQRFAATLADETLTFSEASRRAHRFVNVLAGLGIGKGHRVMFWADISLRALDVFFGCAHAGAVFVPANPASSLAEIRAVAEYLNPHLLVVDRAHVEIGAVLAEALGLRLATLDDLAGAVVGVDLNDALSRANDIYHGPGPAEEDPHVIFLTSGTTGKPKGVLISHRAGHLRARGYVLTEPTSGGGGDVCMFPLFHMAGWTQVTGAMAHLRTVHLTRRADAESLLGIVERWQARRLYCIPPVWERIVECKTRYDMSSLEHTMTGTMRVDPPLLESVRQRFPHTTHKIVYGSTEAGIVLTLGPDEIGSHPDGAGIPAPGVEARIVDGELQTRSDYLMSGYYELPKETEEVFDNDWYRTGDLAECDKDGHYRIIGRRREAIRSGGETVAPAEVEAAIASYPGVQGVAVVGLPDSTWGEVVCAALVMKESVALPSCDALRAYLAPILAKFKHPRQLVALDEIPTTSTTGQIQRGRVREMILSGEKI